MAIGGNYGIDNGDKPLGHNLKQGGRSLTQNAQLSFSHTWVAYCRPWGKEKIQDEMKRNHKIK